MFSRLHALAYLLNLGWILLSGLSGVAIIALVCRLQRLPPLFSRPQSPLPKTRLVSRVERTGPGVGRVPSSPAKTRVHVVYRRRRMQRIRDNRDTEAPAALHVFGPLPGTGSLDAAIENHPKCS